MRGTTGGALLAAALALCVGCAAERRALAGPGEPPPEAGPPLVEAPEPAPLPGGVEVRGELQAGTSGFGGTASVGWSNHRLGAGVTPGLSYASFGSGAAGSGVGSLGTFSLAAWGRVWFTERRPGELAAFAQLEVGVEGLFGELLTGFYVGQPGPPAAVAPGLLAGAAGGAEYLLTPHLGLTVTLGVRLVTLSIPSMPLLGVGLVTGLGFVLHQ